MCCMRMLPVDLAPAWEEKNGNPDRFLVPSASSLDRFSLFIAIIVTDIKSQGKFNILVITKIIYKEKTLIGDTNSGDSCHSTEGRSSIYKLIQYSPWEHAMRKLLTHLL